ncbi:hypothetical protein V6N11_054681 [Hibiscus sabdariffa]|uniref:Uncharacterized protein n=1 Tax=Hibiscus sabdariffa TaxID=183260 RepID=A0ABR2S4N3_9ROSI
MVTPPANVHSYSVLDSNKLDSPSIGFQLVGRCEYDVRVGRIRDGSHYLWFSPDKEQIMQTWLLVLPTANVPALLRLITWCSGPCVCFGSSRQPAAAEFGANVS